MEAIEVYCPKCHAACPASNINISALIAKCDVCDAVFPVPVESFAAPSQTILPPSRPERIQKENDFDAELKLHWRWRTWLVVPLLFFCLFWDGFLVLWYTIAFTQLKGKDADFWMMTLFPVGHLAVGLGLTYFVLASLFNRTVIRIQQGILSIQHGPFYWHGPRDLETSEIAGLEVLESSWTNSVNRFPGAMFYSLAAQDRDGKQRLLLKHLPPDQARYLAYELSTFLNVPLRDNSPAAMAGPGLLNFFRNVTPKGSQRS